MNEVGQRTIQFAENEFYHLYNRGTDKRTIFLDSADYKRFIELLYLCNSENRIEMREIYREHDSVFDFDRRNTLVSIGAYCLMPNHFHVLATPVTENGITKFMNKLGTSYSMYFNKKYQRSGALFQGRFKAEHASDDVYLKYLFSYIHLNPVKLIQSDWKEVGIKDKEAAYQYITSYQYSSLCDYLSEREAGVILNKAMFPEYFTSPNDRKAELFDWFTVSGGRS